MRQGRAVALLLWGLVSVGVTALDAPTALRGAIVVPFVLLGPGVAAVVALPRMDRLLAATLGIGVGLSVWLAVATAVVYLGAIDSVPPAALVAVILVVVGAELGLAARARGQ